MLAAVTIVGLVAVAFLVIGLLIWKKEKITLLHDYHYNNVAEEHKKAFCTLSGIGIFVMGVGMVIKAVLLALTESALSFLAFLLGMVVGLALLIHAGRKYNQANR